MASHTVQIKIMVTVDIQKDAADLQDAISAGNELKWQDLMKSGIEVGEGSHKVVGVWDNRGFDFPED